MRWYFDMERRARLEKTASPMLVQKQVSKLKAMLSSRR
jgi:hypothetical protein